MAGRRGAGEGSVYRRKSDRLWVGQVDLGYRGGKRSRRTFYGRTQREVLAKVDRAREQARSGLLPAEGSQTLAQFLTSWQEEVARPSVRPSTYERYASFVRNHLVPGLGRTRLDKLTPQQVTAFLNERQRAGSSAQTVNHIRAVLRTALSTAVAWGLVNRNVAALASTPSVPKYHPRVLTPAEARQLLEAAKGDRLEALYVLALALGLRQGELLGLRWEDVDLDSRALRITRALGRVKGKGLVTGETKTKRSSRTISPLPQLVVSALERHRLQQDESDRPLAAERWHETGFVFTGVNGTPLDGTNLMRRDGAWQRLLARAQLPHLRFHDLRHSYGTLLVAEGLPAKMVQEALGHSQISLTMDTYAHILPSLQREAADAVDRVLGLDSPSHASRRGRR